tara:strand:- start:418 stop:597 length:180 start_codon:yes stop_codon:yes gene_type:complete
MSSNEFGKIEKLLRQAGLENAECGEIEDRIGMEPPGFGASDSQVVKFEQAINSQQNENV